MHLVGILFPQNDIIFRLSESRTVACKSACVQTILQPAHRLRSSVVFLCPITNYESITWLQAALDASSAAHSKISGEVQPPLQYQSIIIILPTEQKIEHKCSNSFLCCVLLHFTLLSLEYLHKKDERARSGKFLKNKILFPPHRRFNKVFSVTTFAASLFYLCFFVYLTNSLDVSLF